MHEVTLVMTAEGWVCVCLDIRVCKVVPDAQRPKAQAPWECVLAPAPLSAETRPAVRPGVAGVGRGVRIPIRFR